MGLALRISNLILLLINGSENQITALKQVNIGLHLHEEITHLQRSQREMRVVSGRDPANALRNQRILSKQMNQVINTGWTCVQSSEFELINF